MFWSKLLENCASPQRTDGHIFWPGAHVRLYLLLGNPSDRNIRQQDASSQSQRPRDSDLANHIHPAELPRSLRDSSPSTRTVELDSERLTVCMLQRSKRGFLVECQIEDQVDGHC